MIIAGTGHRPNKTGGYGAEAAQNLIFIAKQYLFKHPKDTIVISGMAQGWDQALATAAVELGLKLHAYIPFSGQESKWPADSQREYHRILSLADEVLIVSPGGYTIEKMQVRNEAMVNACNLVLAYYDGTPGGTHNCIQYAKLMNKPIVNLYKYE